MGKVAIVFDSSKYLYHTFAAVYAGKVYQNKGFEPMYVDFGTNSKETVQNYLKGLGPEYLVTFDCVGFDMTLMGGDLFYNSLCCEAAHILFHKPEAYDTFLQKRMNFIMDFFTFSKSEADYIKKYYERVHDCRVLELDYSLLGDRQLNRVVDILLVADYCEVKNCVKALQDDGIPFIAVGPGYEACQGITVVSDKKEDANVIYELACQSRIVVDYSKERPDLNTISSIIAGLAGSGRITLTDDNVTELYTKIQKNISG